MCVPDFFIQSAGSRSHLGAISPKVGLGKGEGQRGPFLAFCTPLPYRGEMEEVTKSLRDQFDSKIKCRLSELSRQTRRRGDRVKEEW